MAIVQNWLPPSRENWELICTIFKWFPLVTLIQWATPWYGMGKTSTSIPGNLPGKWAWLTMEAPGFLTLLTVMFSLPAELGLKSLPWENWVMAGIFTIHYLYRAILCPLIAPSMSPIHIIVWFSALTFQIFNSLSIAGYLAGYGPTTRAAWADYGTGYQAAGRFELGLMVWAAGFVLCIWHDDELREIRRAVARKNAKRAAEAEKEASTGKAKGSKSGSGSGSGVDKVYMIPKNGFFKWILYPHYLFEWIEWTGFWIMGGVAFGPGRSFVLNEVTTMLPRAVAGKAWYVDRFGKDKVGARKAIIPGLL